MIAWRSPFLGERFLVKNYQISFAALAEKCLNVHRYNLILHVDSLEFL